MVTVLQELQYGSMTEKVAARWRPEEACRPILDEAPVFYPNEEEFKDSFKYIASIRKCAEPYGICRIIPPPSWNPPCPLKERNVWENSSFCTSVQQLDKLQNRKSNTKKHRYHKNMKKRRRILTRGMECGTSYDEAVENEHEYSSEAKEFGFEPGENFTLEAFQKFAVDFKEKYFCMKNADIDLRCNKDNLQKQWEPSIENIEGEYWRIVEKPTEEIEVLYGSDIQSAEFGSGFPKSSTEAMDSNCEDKYAKSEWNLNNFSRLPGSILSFESGDISGVMLPWIYFGMLFSSFCWHVEDHHLYSLNYMHWGAPKVWYGVPGKDALKFEAAMKKHLPDLFEEQPDLLHKLVTQLSPSILKSEGVPVYRCVQHPREFVLTFPRAYHAGFSSGFNCAEALNIAPVDWLPYGQRAVELYHEQGRNTTLSHDRLLLGAAREAVRAHWEIQLLRKDTLNNLRWKDLCGKNGILTQALKTRVLMESVRRKDFASQSMKMNIEFDANTEKECIKCHYDLHLSAVGCECSPGQYACLMHASQLCSCAWSKKSFLFRYELNELNVLVEALEGRLSAIHKWAKKDLGLGLSSYVSRSNSKEPYPIGCGLSTEGTKQKDEGLSTASTSTAIADSTSLCNEINGNMPQFPPPKIEKEKDQRRINSTGTVVNSTPLQQQEMKQLPSVNPQTKKRKELGHENKQCAVQSRSSLSEAKIVVDHNIQFSEGKGFSISAPENKGLSDCITLKSKLNIFPTGNGIVINNNEGEHAYHSISNVTYSEIPVTLTGSDIKVTSRNYQDRILNTHKTDASLMNEKDTNFPIIERMEHLLDSVHKKVGHRGTSETDKKTNNVARETFSHTPDYNIKHVSEALGKQIQDSAPCRLTNTDDKKSTLDFCLKVEDTALPIPQCSTSRLGNCDSLCWQKASCIAAAAEINCVVEPLEYGVVLPGKLWSNSKVIFPKGFRSRVRYPSVLDPSEMCHYISEILDAGLPGPLFMVSVEQCPSEVFANLSADKCWDMVRERVNHEIMKQNTLGKTNLPSLQPSGSLNGLGMFGFSSPAIIQAIEAIDRRRICSEYWDCRSGNQKLLNSLPVSSKEKILNKIKEEPHDQEFNNTNPSLRDLFKKANLGELCSFKNMLSGNESSYNKNLLVRLLNEEIHDRRNKSF